MNLRQDQNHVQFDDIAVQCTADDAVNGKLSAASLGYFDDPFLQYFTSLNEYASQRRPPIINRGNFARVASIDMIIREFISQGNRLNDSRQVISLGAGNDTTYFKLHKDNLIPTEGYYEIDFPSVMRRKLHFIRKPSSLRFLQPVTTQQNIATLANGSYHLISSDLRNISEVLSQLLAAGSNPSITTIFLAECVFMYMDSTHSKALLEELSNHYSNAIFVAYEMLHPDDSFGKVMQSNIRSRGCNLPGFDPYPTLYHHVCRFEESGWSTIVAMDMLNVYNNFLDQNEVRRASLIEPLDEIEEWNLIMSHYCLIVAAKGLTGEQFISSLTFPTESIKFGLPV